MAEGSLFYWSECIIRRWIMDCAAKWIPIMLNWYQSIQCGTLLSSKEAETRLLPLRLNESLNRCKHRLFRIDFSFSIVLPFFWPTRFLSSVTEFERAEFLWGKTWAELQKAYAHNLFLIFLCELLIAAVWCTYSSIFLYIIEMLDAVFIWNAWWFGMFDSTRKQILQTLQLVRAVQFLLVFFSG